MPSYKEMYLKLFDATERAINTLINAQLECEELYTSEPKTNIELVHSNLPLKSDEPPASPMDGGMGEMY